MKNWISQFLSSGLGSAVIAVFGTIVAAQVSVFSQPILNQFLGKEPIGWELGFCLAAFTITFILVFLRERGVSQRLEIAEGKLEQQWLRMENRLTNLPPVDVIDNAASVQRYVGLLARTLKQNSSRTEQERVDKVKIVLADILRLVRRWDGVSADNDKITYSANIFWAVESEKLLGNKEALESLKEPLTNSPCFLYTDNIHSRLERCDGILLCQKQFSVSIRDGNTLNEDDHGSAFCMPYTFDNDTTKHPNLPGAPIAYVERTATYIGNSDRHMRDFVDKVSQEYDEYRKRFRKEVLDYYVSDDRSNSMYSIPIFKPSYEPDPSGDEVMAVLNIYCDATEILRSRERSNLFYSMIKPICFHLSKMLELETKEDQKEEKSE